MNTTNIQEGLTRAWNDTLAFLPLLVAFLAILIVGYLICLAIGKLVDAAIERLGIQKMVEKGGLKKYLDDSRIDVSSVLGKVAFYTLFLFVLQLAFSVFGPNAISTLLTSVIAFLPNVFVAVIIVIVTAYLAAAVRDMAPPATRLTYGSILTNILAIAILTLGIFAALDQINIAPNIVNGLFYALLAVIVGSLVIAIGVGGIQPMRMLWERSINRIDQEIPHLQAQAEEMRAKQEGERISSGEHISGQRPAQHEQI